MTQLTLSNNTNAWMIRKILCVTLTLMFSVKISGFDMEYKVNY